MKKTLDTIFFNGLECSGMGILYFSRLTFILIEVSLIYNVVLVSGIHQSESVTHTHIYICIYIRIYIYISYSFPLQVVAEY